MRLSDWCLFPFPAFCLLSLRSSGNIWHFTWSKIELLPAFSCCLWMLFLRTGLKSNVMYCYETRHDVMMCVTPLQRGISCQSHWIMSSDAFMCAKDSSMRPCIYLKTLYSSFLGVLCFIRFMLNSKASLLQACSKNTHWPAWRELSFSGQTWPECDAVTYAGFTVMICWQNCH